MTSQITHVQLHTKTMHKHNVNTIYFINFYNKTKQHYFTQPHPIQNNKQVKSIDCMVKSESVVLTPGDQLNPVQFQQQLRKAARL